jgi:hypothetical protein
MLPRSRCQGFRTVNDLPTGALSCPVINKAPAGAGHQERNMDWNIAYDRMRAVAVAGTLGLALMAVTASADAGNGNAGKARHAQASAQKARSQGDYTRHSEVRRTDNGHTRNDTWTGTRGTATRGATVVNDRENQTRTRNVEWTGPGGQQATRTDVTQRTETGYTRSSTATGPQGGTATRDVVATRDAESGSWTKDVTVERTPPAATTATGGD